LKGNGKGKYLVLLTCVLLFIAAVDTIPDPPAINPPSSPSLRISALYVHGAPVFRQRVRLLFLVSRGSMQVGRAPYPSSQDEEIAAIFPLGLVRHAADSSPPSLFEMPQE
jgi:hypothetical protein